MGSIKKFATSKCLLILSIFALAASIGSISTSLVYSQLFGSDAFQHLFPSVVVPKFAAVITSILLIVVSVRLKTTNSRKLMVTTLILGIVLSPLFSNVVNLIMGNTITWGSGMSSWISAGSWLISVVITGFIVYSLIRRPDFLFASFVIVAIRMALTFISVIINVFQGYMVAMAIVPGISSLLINAVTALYIVSQIPTSEKEKNQSVEEQLATLKMRYENGEISNEEYSSGRNKILDAYLEKTTNHK